MSASDATAREIRAAFHTAGVAGNLHAVDIDRDGQSEIAVGADELVVLASIFKLPLLVAFERAVAAGEIDPTTQVSVQPDGRSPGPTGLSALLDEVRMSLRDLTTMMIAVSDNAAADVVLERVGLPAVAETLEALNLRATRVVSGGRELIDSMLEDAQARDGDELWGLLRQPAVLGRLRALDPTRTSHGTARDLTRLLAAIWREEATTPAGCATVRRLLGLQVWPHRLAAGFPFDDLRVSGKTGTLPTIRSEVGVVEYPDGGRYAVAVFTRASVPAITLPRADAVIGHAARLAVDALRATA